ncbi:hypothetical protein CF319_g7234 [Tilletia indica]|nr:hypothetical protein CF319_g7234 [Tilletia indica]
MVFDAPFGFKVFDAPFGFQVFDAPFGFKAFDAPFCFKVFDAPFGFKVFDAPFGFKVFDAPFGFKAFDAPFRRILLLPASQASRSSMLPSRAVHVYHHSSPKTKRLSMFDASLPYQGQSIGFA